jgi:hypothetical protein
MERSLPLRASWQRAPRASQAAPEPFVDRIPYSIQSFREWLTNRAREAPAAEKLAMLIVQSGAGISRDDLARALQLSPEILDDLLRALTATGQVVMLKVGGRTVYRAAG